MKRYDPAAADLESYRHMTIRATDPARLELSSAEDFRWEGHSVTLILEVKDWPNDSIHFHALALLRTNIYNAARSCCEGHYCQEPEADPSDIPF